MVLFDADQFGDFLKHYGIKRRSGRYPWGSGGNDLSEADDFMKALKELRAEGMSEAKIAETFGFTTSELRANVATANLIQKQDKIFRVEQMKKSGMSNMAISRETGYPESTVRALLQPSAKIRSDELVRTADLLKSRVDADGYIDIGKGNWHLLGISKTKFDVAVAMLTNEGYEVHTVPVPQATSSHDTRVRVLAKPGTTWADANNNRHLIKNIQAFSNDGGKTLEVVKEPIRIDPKRVDVVWGPDGGSKADGVIFVRPGVPDLYMGGASYAQVRIAVGKDRYLKGMAVLKDDLPPGVDLQFNTNKPRSADKLEAMKKIKEGGDPIERFGAVYRQLTNPKTGKQSALNIVNDENNWDDWSKSLASQMLSKQKPDFVKRQLDVTYAKKKAQLDEIMALTNPVVKKKLLEDYAETMDASSVHLKAAALPRQKTHVILPINSLKDNEVYAPSYRDGESVVLIRYPHGGKFEIPELVVNNRNREGGKLIGPNARAAIGINANVANRLSGADFDGDTVVVIPNDKKRISTEKPLPGLKGFDPQVEYRGTDEKGNMLPGVKRMTNTQTQMGMISNLITDMTIAGAPHSHLERAVRHSMVVIDAEKHGLDYKRSAEQNAIAELRKKYQPGRYAGASTIISRTGKKVTVPEVKKRPQAEGGHIDPKTGEVIYVPSGRTKPKPIKDPVTGEITWERVPRTMKVEKGSRMPGTGVKDAFDLVSVNATPIERYYADYSNRVKGLANEARKAQLAIKDPRINPSAKDTYKPEIASLKAKLKEAQSNSPRERQAQILARTIIKMNTEANPAMTADELKRMKSNALRTARHRVGAVPQKVEITDREWQAIQNGAIGSSVLREILTKADMKQVQKLATPRAKTLMQPHNEAKARALLANGYTRAEVADELGVSVSTLDRALG